MARLTAGRTPAETARDARRPRPGDRGRPREATPRCASSAMTWPDYHPEIAGAKALGPDARAGAVRHQAPRPVGRPSCAGHRCSACRSPCRRPRSTGSRPTSPSDSTAELVQRGSPRPQVACGQALIAAAARGLSRPRDRTLARDQGRRDRHATSGRGLGARRRPRRAAQDVQTTARRARHRRVRVERAPEDAGSSPGPLTHPNSPPVNEGDGLLHGDGGRGRPGQHERGVVVPGRRRSPARSTTAGRWPASSASSAPRRTRSWSTASASASSTRPPTTTTCRRRSSSSTPTTLEPATSRAGSSSTASTARGTRWSRPGPADPDPEWLLVARDPRRPGRQASASTPTGWPRRSSGGTGSSRAGRDRDFGRGASAYDRFHGDPSAPIPTSAPSRRPRSSPSRSTSARSGPRAGRVVDGHGRVHARPGPSHPRPLRRGQRDRQPGRPRLLRRGHLDRHGHGVGPPRRHPRRVVASTNGCSPP